MMLKHGLLYLLILIGLIGCVSNRITKYYEFTAPVKEIEHKDLAIFTSLIGTVSTGEEIDRHNVTIMGNPYELLIQIRTISLYYKSVNIAKLKIDDQRGRRVEIPDSENLPTSEFIESPTGYIASLPIKGIELSHEAHRLYIELEVWTKANSQENFNVLVPLAPQYNEKKRMIPGQG